MAQKLRKFMKYLAIISACYLAQSSLIFTNYTPPSSPDLYDKSTTEELQKVVHNKTGNYPGFLLSFGQGRADGYNPRTSYGFGVDYNYRTAVDYWTIWEVGAELFFGHNGHSKAKMDIYFGALLKLGFGYNVAKGVNGIFTVGGGLAKASYSGADEAGISLSSNNDPLGSSFFGSYCFELIRPSGLMPFIGLRWSFFNFNIDKIQQAGSTVSNDKEISFHSPQVFLGLKF